MKKILFLLFCTQLALFTIASPTETEGVIRITGKVLDTDGNPLVGAVVIVENSLLGASTSVNGSYTLNLRRQGEYSVTASFMGFAKETVTITITDDVVLDFTLDQQSIMGEEVVVSATRASNKMPIAKTTLNANDLEERNTGADIPYLLETIPSVVAVSESGTGIGNTSFRIRGTDVSRINVTVNGIPLNDPESQGVYWVNMPDFANSVDNIQVQRGVGTSTQGAGAFGASVNFQTRTFNPTPFAATELQYGSFNTQKIAVKAGSGLLNEKFSFETRFTKLTSDGYIERGCSDHQSLFATGAWHSTNSILRFNFIHGDQHTGITWEGTPSHMLETNRRYNPAGLIRVDEQGKEHFYDNESDNYIQNHYHLIFSHSVNPNLSLNIATFLITGNGYYEQYKGDKKLSSYGLDPIEIGDTTITNTDLVRQKWLDNYLLGTTYAIEYRANRLTTTFGGGFNHYNNDHFGNLLWTSINAGIPKGYEWYRNNGIKNDFNIYSKSTYEVIENLTLFADLQYRTIGYELSGFDDDLASLDQEHSWKFFNPKAGLFYQISPAQEVFASVGVAHREPSRADIKDAMKWGNDQTPKEERLVDYEVGYSFKSQLFALGVNLYYMDYTDQLVLTGKLSDVGYPLMTNVEKSYRAGVEITAALMPIDWLRWDANLALSKNRILDFVEYVDIYNSDWDLVGQLVKDPADTDISFSPSMVASSIFSVQPTDDLNVVLTSKYVSSQYIDNTSSKERKLDAYFVNNLKVGYSLDLKGTKAINFQLIVNNLLNEQYIANGWVYRAVFNDGSPEYREDGFFPQAGINLMGRVVLEF
jgi:iron complex outermembrane receptor protein